MLGKQKEHRVSYRYLSDPNNKSHGETLRCQQTFSEEICPQENLEVVGEHLDHIYDIKTWHECGKYRFNLKHFKLAILALLIPSYA